MRQHDSTNTYSSTRERRYVGMAIFFDTALFFSSPIHATIVTGRRMSDDDDICRPCSSSTPENLAAVRTSSIWNLVHPDPRVSCLTNTRYARI